MSMFDIENKVVFGFVFYDLFDIVFVILEGCYVEEDIECMVLGDLDQMVSFSNFVLCVIIDWQVMLDNLFYVVYVEGQKLGGFNFNQV